MTNSLTNRQQSGFTLIELIVVVVIIGVMASFAVLSISLGHSDEVKQEARRLQALVEIAAQESLLTGGDIGIRFNEQGYGFYTYSTQGGKPEWVPLEEDEHLSKPRELSDLIELELYVEGRYMDIGEELEKGTHVYLFSSGEITPFVLTFSERETGHGYHLIGSITGKLKLQKIDLEDA